MNRLSDCCTYLYGNSRPRWKNSWDNNYAFLRSLKLPITCSTHNSCKPTQNFSLHFLFTSLEAQEQTHSPTSSNNLRYYTLWLVATVLKILAVKNCSHKKNQEQKVKLQNEVWKWKEVSIARWNTVSVIKCHLTWIRIHFFCILVTKNKCPYLAKSKLLNLSDFLKNTRHSVLLYITFYLDAITP